MCLHPPAEGTRRSRQNILKILNDLCFIIVLEKGEFQPLVTLTNPRWLLTVDLTAQTPK